ncbi:MAG: molybdenum cofactor biosysynthesis protein [Verrucomicrobiae bacterium]|nr:molybdenum cofactor biosysynthesis protein [Verrucomicrobiae bacterium]
MTAIEHLYLSPGHNYKGHYGKAAGTHPIVEIARVRCVAGKGIEGDRYFGHQENYKGQITFFAAETHDALCAQFERRDVAPSVYRRNVLLRGADLNAWIGRKFTLQGVEFEGAEECRPCSWMDQAFGPGAEAAMRGRGGLRARILTDGALSVGPV